MIRTVVFVFLLAMASRALCQETPSTLTLAEEAYARHEFLRAARLYEKVSTFHHVPEDVPGKLATCYRELNDYADAAHWYKRITDRNPADTVAWGYYGDALKGMGQYKDAKHAYGRVGPNPSASVLNRIVGCDSAEAWIASPSPIQITNLREINSASSDWGAVWYPPHAIVFTSDSLRASALDKNTRISTKPYQRTGRPFQKIYMMDSSARGLGFIHGFAQVMNFNMYHDGPVAFNRRGDTAYFTITNPEDLKDKGDKETYKEGKKTVTLKVRRLELLWSVKDSTGAWGPAQPFQYDSPAAYSVGHAAFSPDGSVLYFTSDMPGGYGKTDIWYVEKQADGSWSAPINCGPDVNTAEEEAFPTIGADSTLYFASKGRPGMGGYDLFGASGAKKFWSNVHNLRYPINSPGDDFYLTTKDSLSGFLSSDRPGGKGNDDIYAYLVIHVPGLPIIPVFQVIVLKTLVLDRTSGNPIDSVRVLVTEVEKDRRWTSFTGADGLQYKVLDPDAHYTDSAFKPGYSQAGDSVSTMGIHHSDTISVVLYLQKNPQTGDVFVLRKLYYDFDKSNIRPDAAQVLDELIGFLNKYPTMTIDLSSHTDSRGSDDYNLALSQRRAVSARAYLIAHGIPAARVTAQGYGETRLVNGCSNGVPCPAAEHQANRRTEVKVVHP